MTSLIIIRVNFASCLEYFCFRRDARLLLCVTIVLPHASPWQCRLYAVDILPSLFLKRLGREPISLLYSIWRLPTFRFLPTFLVDAVRYEHSHAVA
jgi:hypothetical protein